MDDGSTDGKSGALCDTLAREHPECIRVLHKPNGGAGDARNVALPLAQGEYVLFLDSDDTYTPDAFAVLRAALAETEADICYFSMRMTGKVLVVGENAIKMMTVGGGSSSLKVQHEISPLDGMIAALGREKVDFARGYVGDTTGNYNGVTTGQDLSDRRSPAELIAEAVSKAEDADAVVIFGGLNKSDYQDCEGHDRQTYSLPYGQDELVS